MGLSIWTDHPRAKPGFPPQACIMSAIGPETYNREVYSKLCPEANLAFRRVHFGDLQNIQRKTAHLNLELMQGSCLT